MACLSRKRRRVIGTQIDVLDWSSAISRISRWSGSRESRVVCICNAHSLVTAREDAEFADAVEQADMATSDGAPVAWMLRRLGADLQPRIDGPGLMWRYCAHAADTGESVFLYGGKPATLGLLRVRLQAKFPGLLVAGAYSPPFRPLTEEEDQAVVEEINRSNAGVVWVGLGCPNQEKWMAAHRGRINAVMVGVGAAFDYHAGSLKRAPLWMQKCGLEWLFRLIVEPKRLWRRYLVTNSLFIWHATRQLIQRFLGQRGV